jgi:hypothetical protein
MSFRADAGQMALQKAGGACNIGERAMLDLLLGEIEPTPLRTNFGFVLL